MSGDSVEQNMNNSLFKGTNEKTFIDKILAKDDVNAVRELIKKPELDRQDMLDILYLLSSTESKLLNYSEWDRYVLLKFFVWIREFVKVSELVFDYADDLENDKLNNHIILSDETKRIFENTKRLLSHNVKFLVDLYFNIARTTLSLGATGFSEVLKQKFEIFYPNGPQGSNISQRGKL